MSLKSYFETRKKEQYKDKEAMQSSFTAFIVRGNRQVIKKNITASKKFVIGGDTYIIKQECIFLKNDFGKLRSYAYYIEGNPNPFDFETEVNEGLDKKFLNKFFGGDFYNILLKAQRENRMLHIFVIVLVNMILAMIGFIFTIMGVLMR